jgi:hypothetical protein
LLLYLTKKLTLKVKVPVLLYLLMNLLSRLAIMAGGFMLILESMYMSPIFRMNLLIEYIQQVTEVRPVRHLWPWSVKACGFFKAIHRTVRIFTLFSQHSDVLVSSDTLSVYML